MGKTAEELAMAYYDDVWAAKHIKPAVDTLDKDMVLGMHKLLQINDVLNAGVAGVIVNLCEVCAYNDPKECVVKKFCVDGVVNSNYVVNVE